MAAKSNLVNLDAMLKRADFAYKDEDDRNYEQFSTIPARELVSGSLTGSILRKPDFQRETNHWKPEQIQSLLECYINGDLIPSVILWRSPSYLFVIDGGHRLSVLKAWMEDDYGDGHVSQKMFGNIIPNEQRKAAEKTRRLVNESVNTWAYYRSLQDDESEISAEQRTKFLTLASRGLPVQWVTGNADKAEASFFNINTKGTPLDPLEKVLLENRMKPIPIAARAIIRAGKGHKYWSGFDGPAVKKIENLASTLHQLLFDPEIKRPIKTLDLPLGGSKGIRTALRVLIDFIQFANREQGKEVSKIEDLNDDIDGLATITVLTRSTKLAKKITGNDKGSLGLHPAIYYYGPSGQHSSPMFLGTVSLFAEKLANNDSKFFRKFTLCRGKLEKTLIDNKDLIATILQKRISRYRTEKHHELLALLVNHLSNQDSITEQNIIELSELEGKIVAGDFKKSGKTISDEEKSKTFIGTALKNALQCPICQGYLDVEKSVSYDHIELLRDGGASTSDNVQLTHSYCNNSIKN